MSFLYNNNNCNSNSYVVLILCCSKHFTYIQSYCSQQPYILYCYTHFTCEKIEVYKVNLPKMKMNGILNFSVYFPTSPLSRRLGVLTMYWLSRKYVREDRNLDIFAS